MSFSRLLIGNMLLEFIISNGLKKPIDPDTNVTVYTKSEPFS